MNPIQSIKAQLLREYPFTIELHAHTNPVSSCSDLPPAEMVLLCKQAGAQGVVVTNHTRIGDKEKYTREEWAEHQLKDFREALEAGNQLGIRVYLGMEIRFPENRNEYLVFGIDEDFVYRVYDYLDKDLHTFYRDFHCPELLIIQAHPYRDGLVEVDAGDLDGYEVFNLHPSHNSRVSVAAAHYAKHGGVITGGTDFHHRGHEGQLLTCFRQMPEDNAALVQMLRSGDYIFRTGNNVLLP